MLVDRTVALTAALWAPNWGVWMVAKLAGSSAVRMGDSMAARWADCWAVHLVALMAQPKALQMGARLALALVASMAVWTVSSLDLWMVAQLAILLAGKKILRKAAHWAALMVVVLLAAPMDGSKVAAVVAACLVAWKALQLPAASVDLKVDL